MMLFRLSFSDCYRKKQRGDCNSLEFIRAAAEKAQYVHNRYHPDQQQAIGTTRLVTCRDITRHPSLSLRQLERQFLSHQVCCMRFVFISMFCFCLFVVRMENKTLNFFLRYPMKLIKSRLLIHIRLL
jgi:hypothetical protein